MSSISLSHTEHHQGSKGLGCVSCCNHGPSSKEVQLRLVQYSDVDESFSVNRTCFGVSGCELCFWLRKPVHSWILSPINKDHRHRRRHKAASHLAERISRTSLIKQEITLLDTSRLRVIVPLIFGSILIRLVSCLIPIILHHAYRSRHHPRDGSHLSAHLRRPGQRRGPPRALARGTGREHYCKEPGEQGEGRMRFLIQC